MRRLIGIILIALLAVGDAALAAENTDTDVRKNRLSDGIQYNGSLPGAAGNQQQGGGASRGNGGPSQPVFRGRYPVLGADPATGQQCVDTATRTFPSQAEATNFELAQEQRWRTLLEQYPPCPNAALPQVSPATLASVFWGEVLLPHPAPKIEPGWAMTGRLAYLETQAPLTQTFTRDTPLGPLAITATGEFLVDWGDGTTTGPHKYAGEPWPDGRITHGYTRTGTVNVVVTERWQASWQLAGETGTLTALSTEGRLDGFVVREVQAVRNR